MHWQPYTPDDRSPWNLRRVAHLHRRAGFAAPWEVLQRDLKDSPQAAVDRLLAGNEVARTPDDFASLAATIGDAAVASGNVQRLKAWWLYRMMFSPDPLGERLTLLWHNHFATSNRKVQDVAMMRRQNELFRQFARGPFDKLLAAVVKDPAMLVWLDADSNRREHPNENLARELMELFTIGVGNYGEDDVKQAARALTGWTVKNREFREVAAYHDDGEKTILSRSGKWRGDDLVAMLLEQPATSVRLARRVCELLMGEGVVEPAAIDELAAGLREHSGENRGSAPATAQSERVSGVQWAVETVLRSEAFFAETNIGNRVLAPAEYIVGAVRALEVFDPPPSTIVLAEWAAALGQDLFEPPNVFGWAGGRSWINTRSLIARANFAQRLAEGALQSSGAPPDWPALARRHGCGENAEDFSRFLAQTLWTGEDGGETKRTEQTIFGEQTALTPENARRAVAAMLGSPRAQLG
ncbi:MAG TPA: DUF1800 domain-containing protein [Pirellulales bacterium]|nr:DUF1800 domain-containing protein [Pirellulales bacterium]